MYNFWSKSEGVPFQALGDLTWNDPASSTLLCATCSPVKAPEVALEGQHADMCIPGCVTIHWQLLNVSHHRADTNTL